MEQNINPKQPKVNIMKKTNKNKKQTVQQKTQVRCILPPNKVVTDRKKEGNRKACRGKVKW